jgi:hypothetical protein
MIQVNLVGGLGNQLFQYYAGLYAAGGDPKKLKIRTAFSEFGRTGHHSTIENVGLPGNFRSSSSDNKISWALEIGRREIELRLAAYSKYFLGGKSSLRWFQAEDLGRDDSFESRTLSSKSSLWGFFQTWKYAHDLRDEGKLPKPFIEAQSDWYRAQIVSQKDSESLVLHVRRGDYTKEGNSFGLLSEKYYTQAISLLREAGARWDVGWIYTDEPALVSQEFAGLIQREQLRIVIPPVNSHPMESLLAMSESDYLVIGNSSFSWWSAFFSDRAKIVMRPEKWFRSLNDPLDLFPQSWVSMPSDWQEFPPNNL